MYKQIEKGIHGKTQGERNFIMQVVCEATQSDYAELQIAAFQCLVRIMQTYYDKMRIYMEKALFGVKRKKKMQSIVSHIVTSLLSLV